MEDVIYDQLYRELSDLEKNFPALISLDSPTQRVGGPVLEGFQSRKHRIPLFSLDNAFNFDEVVAWYRRVLKLLESSSSVSFLEQGLSMVGELKIDGNAIALTYQDGVLIRAVTRGDGSEGEDITANVRTISSIPLRLLLTDPPRWLEVRGEAFIPNRSFQHINIEREKKGEPLFANPRNACAGTLRQLNPKVVSSRNLDFFAYTMYLPDDWLASPPDPDKPKEQWEALRWLQLSGFKVNPNAKQLSGLSELEDFFQYWEQDRHDLAYATDGVVVKLNQLALQEAVGFTQKAPRWAIALKYPAEEAPTKLLSLTFQVGRTGALTPVAEFEPVILAGTTVAKATLHNADRLESLDLFKGDTIIVRKAGEIIPEVVCVLKDLRPSTSERLLLPTTCPECQSNLVRETGQSVTKCINSSCPAILRGILRHWVSKKSLDVDGFGVKLIEQLVDQGLVSSIVDLYRLEVDQLVGLDRMGRKSAENLLKSLETSKEKPWEKQLFGLGIHHVGEVNAKLIASQFRSATELSQAVLDNPERISSIHGIGGEIVQSIVEWFSEPSNQNLLIQLEKEGFSFSSQKYSSSKASTLSGKTFVLTGTLPSLKRNDAIALIEDVGGIISTSVSKNTNYLVAGENPGSKLNKAKRLEISIINEDLLLELINKSLI